MPLTTQAKHKTQVRKLTCRGSSSTIDIDRKVTHIDGRVEEEIKLAGQVVGSTIYALVESTAVGCVRVEGMDDTRRAREAIQRRNDGGHATTERTVGIVGEVTLACQYVKMETSGAGHTVGSVIRAQIEEVAVGRVREWARLVAARTDGSCTQTWLLSHSLILRTAQ